MKRDDIYVDEKVVIHIVKYLLKGCIGILCMWNL